MGFLFAIVWFSFGITWFPFEILRSKSDNSFAKLLSASSRLCDPPWKSPDSRYGEEEEGELLRIIVDGTGKGDLCRCLEEKGERLGILEGWGWLEEAKEKRLGENIYIGE